LYRVSPQNNFAFDFMLFVAAWTMFDEKGFSCAGFVFPLPAHTIKTMKNENKKLFITGVADLPGQQLFC
jgi:hypothetical protein